MSSSYIPSSSSASLVTQASAPDLAKDAYFWLALAAFILLVGIGVGLLALILYRRFYLKESREGDLETAKAKVPPLPRDDGHKSRFFNLLIDVKVVPVSTATTGHLGNTENVVTYSPSQILKEEETFVHEVAKPSCEVTESRYVPEIIVSPPSTPSLIYDDTPSSEEESLSATVSLAPWSRTENFRGLLAESDVIIDVALSKKDVDKPPALDAMFDQLEAAISGSVPPVPIIEEQSPEVFPDLASETSVLPISELFDSLNVGDDAPHFEDLELSVGSPTEVYDFQFLEIPPVCHTQTERHAAELNSRYPRFIVTSATIKRSALQSPVNVHWKKFKRTIPVPAFVSGVALSSKNKLTPITEAARGQTFFAKHVRRDTPYIWPTVKDKRNSHSSSNAQF